ncbi:lytic transglycosylase domain-containing protein [uncultured Brevundimonas sp.]|uniref:lytic transglycosylase domain-containing protein n=1 Tax=uncultured Brevundimonas sp. TaxID=213418 RepID=UPI0030ECC4F7|tara:strand:- start:870 stop:2531 length:1662 start_codon:yes stop_codon:yes gene_type:complete
MRFYCRAIIIPALATAMAVFATVASAADEDPRRPPSALSSADRLSYTTAFDALRRGDLDLARASAREAQDHVLLGQVEFERLFHRDYTATYEDLSAWLEEYADLPDARRAYDLALRRRPDGAPEPRRPAGVGGRSWNSVLAADGGGSADDPMKAARIAYNADDLAGAETIGEQIGDWWTVGLATYRQGEFAKALTAFDRVARDPTEDAWVRAGAAVWCAKSAAQSGRHDRIQDYLRMAARWPATFYGQIALRQLGEEPVIENLGPRAYEAVARHSSGQAPEPVGVDANELNDFILADPRARRTVAYFEIGRRDDARSELKTGLRTAVGDAAREMWAGLARALGPRVTGSNDAAERIDADRYPMPVLEPEGGFTIERALVYAIARKETGFNADARSGAGAYGMMQVMPTTAAEMTGDRGFVTNPDRLLQPAVNLRLGQAYINKMLQMSALQGDLLRAAASYNAGPGPMLGAIRKLGQDADPLLLIETIDVPQARDYVEKVVAAYWIYQRMLGAPLNTLDAVASGARAVPINLDYVAPLPAPVEVAATPSADGGR